ncbi:MAG: hypothetical protein AAFN48_07230, partial [Pseudomonadota bacterium]
MVIDPLILAKQDALEFSYSPPIYGARLIVRFKRLTDRPNHRKRAAHSTGSNQVRPAGSFVARQPDFCRLKAVR